MVIARCRSPLSARWWNGRPAQSTTGAAAARYAHCQPRERSRGTSVGSDIGPASASATFSLERSLLPGSIRSLRLQGCSLTCAAYPASRTAPRSWSESTNSGSNSTAAVSVARFTLACTPSSRFRLLSTVRTQAAQLIPSTARSMRSKLAGWAPPPGRPASRFSPAPLCASAIIPARLYSHAVASLIQTAVSWVGRWREFGEALHRLLHGRSGDFGDPWCDHLGSLQMCDRKLQP